MDLDVVVIIFQVVVFLFAISAHEAAHAYVAWRCGDPTARMLGRVTLNPLRHIDIFGTILLPLLAIIFHFPVIGWAKPTPVNPRNFGRHVVRSDILTSLAGPVSNLLLALLAVGLLALVSLASPQGSLIVKSLAMGMMVDTGSPLLPLCLLLYQAMFINVLLAVFNVIPVPPLDGSHVIRHLLSPGVLRVYDMVGTFGILLLFFLGGRVLFFMMAPFLNFFHYLLARV